MAMRDAEKSGKPAAFRVTPVHPRDPDWVSKHPVNDY